MKETIYNGRDNSNILHFKRDGKPIDFTGATRMTCSFSGSSVVADSAQDATLFDWTQGGGKVLLKFNDLSVPAGTYRATFVVFDVSHPDGQVLAGVGGAELFFEFVD